MGGQRSGSQLGLNVIEHIQLQVNKCSLCWQMRARLGCGRLAMEQLVQPAIPGVETNCQLFGKGDPNSPAAQAEGKG